MTISKICFLRGLEVGSKYGLTEHSGESEVAQLDDAVFGDEDVLGLHVTVDAVVEVAVVDGLQSLPDDAHRQGHRNSD